MSRRYITVAPTDRDLGRAVLARIDALLGYPRSIASECRHVGGGRHAPLSDAHTETAAAVYEHPTGGLLVILREEDYAAVHDEIVDVAGGRTLRALERAAGWAPRDRHPALTPETRELWRARPPRDGAPARERARGRSPV